MNVVCLPQFLPLDVHIGLSERKRVDIRLRVQVGQAVVDESMGCFVGTHCVDDVEHSSIWLQPPIIPSNAGRWFI